MTNLQNLMLTLLIVLFQLSAVAEILVQTEGSSVFWKISNCVSMV